MDPAIIGVPVVVAARGAFAVESRRRRPCFFASSAGGTKVRQHATLPTAVVFAIVAKLANLAVETATSVNKRLGAVPKQVIRTMTVETAALVVPKDLSSFFGVGQGRP